MLDVTVITPWEYSKKILENNFAYVNILMDPFTIKERFRETFLQDRFDDEMLPVIPEYDMTRQIYRDYIHCFRGSEVHKDPFEVENPWMLKSGTMHCLADTIYADILLGMIIIADSDRGYQTFIRSFNDITLRFLIEREEKYKVCFSCFGDFFSLLPESEEEPEKEPVEEYENYTINGKKATREMILELPCKWSKISPDILRSSIEANKAMDDYELIIPDHYKEMSFLELGNLNSEHKEVSSYYPEDWRIHVYSETIKKECSGKYAGALWVTKTGDGSFNFFDENIYTYYANIGCIIADIIEDEEGLYDTVMLALYEDEYKINDYQANTDILKKVAWYIHIDFNEKTASIWDGGSICGKNRFCEAFEKADIKGDSDERKEQGKSV